MSGRVYDFEYVNDLRILKRFVQAGSFGYKEFDDEVFKRLSNRYPEAYQAFGKERKQDVLKQLAMQMGAVARCPYERILRRPAQEDR